MKTNNLEDLELYMNFNYTFDSNDEGFDNDTDEPHVGYYLSTSKEKNSCSDFLIFFNNDFQEPILASIEVKYDGEDFFIEPTLFKKTNKDDECLFFSVNGTDGDCCIDYKSEDIKNIIPLNEI